MNLDRKWSRIEEASTRDTPSDLYRALCHVPDDVKDRGSVLADIGDMRRYFLLVGEYTQRGSGLCMTFEEGLQKIIEEHLDAILRVLDIYDTWATSGTHAYQTLHTIWSYIEEDSRKNKWDLFGSVHGTQIRIRYHSTLLCQHLFVIEELASRLKVSS